MSQLGHERTIAGVRDMSAVPPRTDIRLRGCHVHSVPRADLIYMTYCLLLTPDEAGRQFQMGIPVPDQHNRDDWDE